jgi:hypothetical protein
MRTKGLDKYKTTLKVNVFNEKEYDLYHRKRRE